MRETGPIRKRFDGDIEAAKDYTGLGRTVLGDLKQRMTAGGLQQLSRQITLSDGTIIRAQSVYGQDTVSVETGAVAPAGAKEAETVVAENDQFIKYYYSGNIVAPCVCRGLSIVVTSAIITFPVMTSSVSPVSGGFGTTFTATWSITDYTGNVVATGIGTQITAFDAGSNIAAISVSNWPNTVVSNPLIPGIPISNYNAPALGIAWQVFNGATSWSGSFGVNAPWVVGQSSGGWSAMSPTYEDLLAQAVAAANAKRKTLILLSDNTQLAVIPYTDDGAGDKTNYPQIVTWSGDGWIQLFNTTDNDSTWTAGSRNMFVVPDDVCRPALPDTAPTLPNGSAVSLPTWAADWAAARAASTIRERARVKTCSDNLKTNLKAGVLQDQVKLVLRSGHPVSAKTYQKALMTASISNSSAGSGDDITNTKTVTLSYQSTDSSGNPITLQQIVVGTQHIVITRCANSSGTPNIVNYTATTYTNWLPIATNGDSGIALDYTYQLDNTHGLAQMWNGVVVTGASSIAATFDSFGGLYVPPYLQSSDSRSYSYPQLYIDYRAATVRLYKTGSHNTAWLDSAFLQNEIVDIFPLSTIHVTLGDLGMFPQTADISDTTKLTLRADMKGTYTYDYKTGLWTGGGANLQDANQNDTTVPLPYQAGVNCVFRSRVKLKDEWPDVVTTYQAQAADMKANPSSYPLFVPLDSL